jgi:hypothetical protein
VLSEIDPDEVWYITFPEERIPEIKEAGGKLKILKEKSAKEIKKENEKAIETYL